MMKLNEIPVATAKKALSVWVGKEFLFTENFPEFLHEISLKTQMVQAIHGSDYFLVLEKDIPLPQIHGMFRNWDDLFEVAKTLGHSFHMVTHFCPAPDQASANDPILLYTRPGQAENKTSQCLGEIDLEEAAAFIQSANPELYNQLYYSLIKDSLAEKLFTVIRDENGKMVFLHLVRKSGKNHDGVYLWSSLPFGESVREFRHSLDRLAIGTLTSLILKSNERSLEFHKFLGFQFTEVHSYRLSYHYP